MSTKNLTDEKETKELFVKITKIFDDNTLDDLKRFLNKRKNLNLTNSYLIYVFHLLQSSSIFISSIGAGNSDQRLIWLGIALNILASLINIYEKTNNNILKKLLIDIKTIKDGNYIDEGQLIDTEQTIDSAKSKLLPTTEQTKLLNKNTNIYNSV